MNLHIHIFGLQFFSSESSRLFNVFLNRKRTKMMQNSVSPASLTCDKPKSQT